MLACNDNGRAQHLGYVTVSITGKQSPIGINVLGALLNNTGFTINPVAKSFMGTSKINGTNSPGIPNLGGDGYTFGRLVQDTVLRMHTWTINDAYHRNVVTRTSSSSTYDNLISIGSETIPALGNSKPASYIVEDPSNNWTTRAVQSGEQKDVNPTLPGPATTGYALTNNQGQGQQASWLPYTGVTAENPNSDITQWGYIRLHALQAWNEFNWNGASATINTPEYKDFVASFLSADAFVTNSNQTIFSMHEAKTFLSGIYSNLNDLITSDITGVNLSTWEFGNDLKDLGKTIDLTNISSFGLPSTLLNTLYKSGAITPEMMLIMLASGVSTEEINNLAIGQTDTSTLEAEQRLYSAFTLIGGKTLVDILALLECKTKNITRLADLLDVKKLFPNSFASLTVPIYNISPGPTNSKTYYLLFSNGGVNSQITSPEVDEIVGIQPTFGKFILNKNSQRDEKSQLPKGFGSYLKGILPPALAATAGAFSYSMQQISNIQNCNFESFARVVRSMETNAGLPLAGGTDTPADPITVDLGLNTIALGSGLHGSFTLSDIFGCMSGLPYPWQKIYERVEQLQTVKLKNIYRENFLAVTWEQAEISVEYETRIVEEDTEYRATGFTIINPGGGYGRGGAPAPTITCDSGATGTTTIGTNDILAASCGGGEFGRVLTVSLTGQGSWQLTPPVAYIQCPPTENLPIATNGSIPTNGTNTASSTVGWPNMNDVVDLYITQANTEIALIKNNNPGLSALINAYWDICGLQLAREQRARYLANTPVPIIEPESTTQIRKDDFMNAYPGLIYAFVDTLPTFSHDTRPHMAAQTIEAISDFGTAGGQNIIALMRESRNKAKLMQMGLVQQNNLPTNMTEDQQIQVTTNGVIQDSTSKTKGECSGYTMPAWPVTLDARDEPIAPIPVGIFLNGEYRAATALASGDIGPLLTDCGDIAVATVVPIESEEEELSDSPYIISVPEQFKTPIPSELDIAYISSTLLSSRLTIQEAIDKIIECNCDCWVN
jgi:hypothetical protein